jgi:peptidyl-prolyl cis-trans isomerase C
MVLGLRTQQLLREPLNHFLLAGLALFALEFWRGERVDPASRTVEVSEAQIDQLTANWMQTWHRAPTPAELDGIIQDQIREEVYYREAKRLGLDQDDLIIRRRLRAKMEALEDASADALEPSDAELQSMIDRNPARYAEGARISFDQIFLSTGNGTAERARLSAGESAASLGQPAPLSRQFEAADSADIDAQFGEGFTARLVKLPLGEWSGPVQSGLGNHLVLVHTIVASAPPKLDQIRTRVENDWRADARLRKRDAGFKTLLSAYTVRIAKLK